MRATHYASANTTTIELISTALFIVSNRLFHFFGISLWPVYMRSACCEATHQPTFDIATLWACVRVCRDMMDVVERRNSLIWFKLTEHSMSMHRHTFALPHLMSLWHTLALSLIHSHIQLIILLSSISHSPKWERTGAPLIQLAAIFHRCLCDRYILIGRFSFACLFIKFLLHSIKVVKICYFGHGHK